MNICDLPTDEKLKKEHIEFLVYGIDNKLDYLTLNKIENKVLSLYGKKSEAEMRDKVEYIAAFILAEDMDGLWGFYESCCNQYLKSAKEDNAVGGFNVMFITLIHIASKIIRKLGNI